MQKYGLSELLAPISVQEFYQFYWPKKPLFIQPQKGKFKELIELPELKCLTAIIESRHLKVRACLPDFDDEYSSIYVEPSDARKAYQNNMTLVFDSMHKENARIAEVLENIRKDLGLVTGGIENNLCRSRSIIYATPAGGRTRLHFDANVNLIIQLSGMKRWVLAPNQSVENPTERFTAGSFEMSMALEKQCHAPLLDELPEDSIELVMEPGCVLFVPRGYWHETSTDEDSLSLNFTFSQPTWADLFTKSMQELLITSPEWRELADGLDSHDINRKNKGIARFEELVKQLSIELPEITGKLLLEESGIIL